MQAYSAVFGNGSMVKPHFVESIRDAYDSSKVVYQAETEITGTPITTATAKQLQTILYETVQQSSWH
jgi:penicillin-binding protein 2B